MTEPDRNSLREPGSINELDAPVASALVPGGFEAKVRGVGLVGPEQRVHQAMSLAHLAAEFRRAGDELTASGHFRDALGLANSVLVALEGGDRTGEESPVRLLAVRMALNCGEMAIARELIEKNGLEPPPTEAGEEWCQVQDITLWPDAWLIAGVRHIVPDKQSLDELARRYWKKLSGRCYLLTANRENALDLAQDAWFRVLKYRKSLKPGGNFSAYIATVATSLWRDRFRLNQRAGALGEHAMVSLDMTFGGDAGESISLIKLVPDLASLEANQKRQVEQDIDSALANLPPLLREILVARYIDGESCAAIGRRFERTEQTISGWVRRGLQEMKIKLSTARDGS